MELRQSRHGKVLIVSPPLRRIDASTASVFRSALLDVVKEPETKVVVDLSEMDFMDSGALGALISALKAAKGEDGFAVCGATGSIARLFEITKMSRVLRVYADEREALAALG